VRGAAAALALAAVLPFATALAEGSADLLQLHVRRGEERATALSAVLGEAPALVAFSASYCPPCRAEVPVLRRASSRWKREGVRVIAIAVDVGDAAEAAAVARDWGIDYDLYWLADDARDDARRLAPAGLPVTFFVGRAGVSRLDRLLTDEDVDRLVPERLGVRASPGDR